MVSLAMALDQPATHRVTVGGCCLVINVAHDDVRVGRGVRLDTGRVAVIRDDVMRDW